MSIALDRIDIATSFGLIFESPPAVEEAVASSSSSIGKNSDASGRSSSDDGEENDEAQSSYKGPLDMMDALEEVLPLRLELNSISYSAILIFSFSFSGYFVLLYKIKYY